MKLRKIFAVITAAVITFSLLTVSAGAAKKGITLSKSSVSVTAGKTFTLKADVTGYKKYTVVWSSSNSSVASVAKGGKVTAKKAGSATITAKIKGTDYKATCKVTVKKAGSTVSSSDKTGSISSKGTAMDFVKNIKIGWNLGNTLDCTGSWINGDLAHETAWGNVKTTEDMIKAVKKAGFNTVRIPVSWGEHLDSKNNISKAWMDRVQEVVDYAIDNGMYVILNTHHEGGWLIPSKDSKAMSDKFTSIWKQIAARFKNYDEHLIFEGMNEPKTNGSAKEWSGGTAEERKVINKYNRLFVDTIRATGGNNKLRYLMVTPYGASSSSVALKDLEVPKDDRVIVSVHAYLPYNMALNTGSAESKLTDAGKKEIDNFMNTLNTYFIQKGIPVIIGEFGSLNRENEAERIKLAEYYISSAKKLGIPCIWWDNGTKCKPSEGEGFGLLDRKNLKWWFEDLVKALVKAAK